jgi:autotransporter-associated beta strand protein
MRNLTQNLKRVSAFMLALTVVMAWSGEVMGQTEYEWRSEAANGNWHAPTHWWIGSATTAGFGVMRFNNNAHPNMTNNNGGITFSTHAIHFRSGNTSVRTIDGDPIRLFDFGGADPYILNTSSATHVIDANLRGDGDAGDPLLFVLDGTGGLTINGTVNNEGSNINIQGSTPSANTITFNGVISGSGGLFKNTPNITAVFNAANTFTGTTTIENGSLRLGQAGASFGGAASDIRIGAAGVLDLNGFDTTVRYISERGTGDAGIVTLGSGTLTIQDDGSTTRFQSSINGTGNIVYDSAPTSVMSLFNAQGWSGSTTVKGGTLTSAGSMQTSSVTIEGGIFRVTGSDNRLAANPSVTVTAGTFNPRTNETITDLTVHSGAIVSIESGRTLTVNGVLDIQNGATVDFSRIIMGPSGSITTTSADVGAETLSRSITGSAGWRTLAAPVASLQVGQIQNMVIQGVNADGFQPNVYSHWDGANWQPVTNSAHVLNAGQGFLWYYFANNQAGSTVNPTISVTGSQPSDVLVNLNPHSENANARFTLIGNPYGHNVDVSRLIGRGAASQSVVQYWEADSEAEGGGSWVLSSANNDRLALWQGAMIETNAGQTGVFIPNIAKTNTETTFYKESNDDRVLINFELRGVSADGTIQTVDRAATLLLHDRGSNDWDQWDASKFFPMTYHRATIGFEGMRDGATILQSQLSLPIEDINSLNVPMDFAAMNMGGTFTLSVHQLKNLPQGLSVFVEDTHTGVTTDLTLEDYVFSYNAMAKIARGDNMNPEFGLMSLSDSPRFVITLRTGNPTSVSDETRELPELITLSQNFPNPFNPTTSIRFELPERTEVRLAVYDLTGREVATLANGAFAPGSHSVNFSAAELSSGVYVYRLDAAGQTHTRKMTLIK